MGLNGNGNGHAKVAKSAPATDESVDEPVDEAAADEE